MRQGPTVMYTTTHHASQAGMNNIGGDLDGSGTINPAALNTPVLPTPTSLNNVSTQSPRGQKRSRSPENYVDIAGGPYGDNDDNRPKKRGRPPKERDDLAPLQSIGQPVSGQLPTPQSTAQSTQSQQSQQQQAPPVPQAAPKQASPAKPTQTKTVVKALPTVRDHTTDQLNPEHDEYIPRETDADGEKKVESNGRLTGGREYKCRTFLVPNRGDKLFMLATECARVLGYRDSYLLFNKNRSLYKIIATQPEKDDLIHQDILPYSYRSRQIAIVTARSMFRQFGSRVVNHGRRVRDDYWEAKARKQGFTEEDLAGEKRPGAAKREAAAQEAAANAAAAHPHSEIVYSNALDSHGHPVPMGYGTMMGNNYAPLPMITPAPDDMRGRGYNYNDIPRPKQEINAPQFQEKGTLTSMSEIMNQANHTAEYNRGLNQGATARGNMLKDYWKREQPIVSSPVQQDSATASSMPQSMQSPLGAGGQQPMLPPQGQSAYQQQPAAGGGSPNNMRNQAPHMAQRASNMPYGSGQVPQSPNYGYPSSQMWQQHPSAAGGAPQQPALASHSNMPQYSPQTPGHPQQHPQSPHPSQSPHHLPGQGGQQHQNAATGMQPPQQMGYQVPGMSMQHPYGGMPGRNMYPQPHQSPQTYMQQSGPGAAGGMAGWAPSGGQQNWQGQNYQ